MLLLWSLLVWMGPLGTTPTPALPEHRLRRVPDPRRTRVVESPEP